jgi:hypothetical protein
VTTILPWLSASTGSSPLPATSMYRKWWSVFQASIPSSIRRRCSTSSTTCMCEQTMNTAVVPPLCMSITTSDGGMR